MSGRTLEVTVGGPAHGGSCVARYPEPDGRAVFVRHALPGERVRAVVTSDRGGAYCFADAVEVLEASPDRVEPPCPYAGPGRCGGCDWQHATPAAQRELKAAVIRDQFARIARQDVSTLLHGVEELPGGPLGWRTRNLYAVGRDGRVGLRKHASHEIVTVEHCPLGVPGVADPPEPPVPPRGVTGIEAARGTLPDVAVLAHRAGGNRQRRGRRPPDRVEVVTGPRRLHHHALGRDFRVAAGGFWQVHPAAVEAFAAALLAAVRPAAGERVLDLYAGAGALTAALAAAVGESGAVIGVESSRTAVADAAANLADLPQARVRHGRVTADALTDLAVGPDVVVLDPPRTGAGRDVMTALIGLGPRAIGYVACDPAALARDVAVAAEHGWRLASLRAFDAFPMTHHVECVAGLVPPGAVSAG
ncbi:23S rRNA m(5)U-1939 methyltransferase [Jatrophihabitans endophyticus]|uniref:23S rRNA m(5)U-1939 methyltransferase n=1 Tax=Jatrophihabitans endophyticus TaxID=1206085 RepID=A0A1M5M6Z4_9ACTN|nr:23S rRNA m(5)U-1939 methyltransferase [Jatrophihabitans endophyticus]